MSQTAEIMFAGSFDACSLCSAQPFTPEVVVIRLTYDTPTVSMLCMDCWLLIVNAALSAMRAAATAEDQAAAR